MREKEKLRTGVKGGLPTISDYIDALRNPYGRFRTLGEPQPRTDTRGEILFYAGNNAVVFPAVAQGRNITVKCYIKKRANADIVYSYLSGLEDSLLTPARLLKEEVYVYDIFDEGGRHDVVAADWADGVTLETAITRAAREDGFTFGGLSAAFGDMALRLLGREWAHGDLKPENIIVHPDGTLRLIDYDAMFVPELAGRRTLEVGTPPYQHPARDQTLFDKSIDDYPIALIAASLRALALDPTLYARHNRTDNIILYPAEILDGTSEGYTAMLRLFAERGDHASYNLALSLRTPLPRIENLVSLLSSPVAYPVVGGQQSKAADVTSEYSAASRLTPFPGAGGLWGYRTSDDSEVIPPVYETAFDFTEGLAVVRIDGIWQVIDAAGTLVVDCSGYDAVKPFSEGLAPVCREGKWGFITPGGVIAVEPRYEMAGIFREGFAVIKSAGRYGYIDAAGKTMIEPMYDYATGFRNGRATVSMDGQILEIGCPVVSGKINP